MKRRYYIVRGLQPWTTEDEKKLDKLVPKAFVGNVEYSTPNRAIGDADKKLDLINQSGGNDVHLRRKEKGCGSVYKI